MHCISGFSIAPLAVLIFFMLIFVVGAIVTLDHKELQRKEVFATEEIRPPATSELRDELTEEPNICENQCRPSGSEALPRGIVQDMSNFEMEFLVLSTIVGKGLS